MQIIAKAADCASAYVRKNLLRASENVNAKGYNYAEQIDAEKCTACKLCAIICPDAAISVYK